MARQQILQQAKQQAAKDVRNAFTNLRTAQGEHGLAAQKIR
jgi:outer membrane protein TolC